MRRIFAKKQSFASQLAAPLLILLVLAGAAVIVGFIVVSMKPPPVPEAAPKAAAAAAIPRRGDAPDVPRTQPPAPPDPDAALPKSAAPLARSLDLIKMPPAPAPKKPRTSCVRKTGDEVDEPETLEDLLTCQETFRRRRPGDEAFAERQRAEVRDYLARHPERAATDEPAPVKDGRRR